jgi:hypothetical protein
VLAFGCGGRKLWGGGGGGGAGGAVCGEHPISYLHASYRIAHRSYLLQSIHHTPYEACEPQPAHPHTHHIHAPHTRTSLHQRAAYSGAEHAWSAPASLPSPHAEHVSRRHTLPHALTREGDAARGRHQHSPHAQPHALPTHRHSSSTGRPASAHRGTPAHDYGSLPAPRSHRGPVPGPPACLAIGSLRWQWAYGVGLRLPAPRSPSHGPVAHTHSQGHPGPHRLLARPFPLAQAAPPLHTLRRRGDSMQAGIAPPRLLLLPYAMPATAQCLLQRAAAPLHTPPPPLPMIRNSRVPYHAHAFRESEQRVLAPCHTPPPPRTTRSVKPPARARPGPRTMPPTSAACCDGTIYRESFCRE